MRRVKKQERERFIGAALRAFGGASRSVPRDVTVVFLVTALVLIAGDTWGGKRFFFTIWYPSLGGDPRFELWMHEWWFAAAFLLYFVVPVLLVLALHRARPSDFGLGAGDVRFGLTAAALSVAVMLPVLWIVSAEPAFRDLHPYARVTRINGGMFAVYEATFLLYFIGWEYLWRGYMLFGLRRHIGDGAAVLAQMLPFTLLHFGKPAMETFGAVAAGIALGAVALRARSFWYGVLTHWAVMFLMDALSVLRWRAGAAGTGMDDVLRIIRHLLHG
jgi:uncharacterized protein